MTVTPEDVITFWRDDVGDTRWFASDAKLDAEISRRFGALWEQARCGGLADWELSADGALALVIVLDQFPRNMFRDTGTAFESDAMVRRVAIRAVENGFDLIVPASLRAFSYMPFMYSENIEDQDRAVELIGGRIGTDRLNYPYALEHRETIRRFGRFPLRNEALGRQSTPEELAFLSVPARH
jgi:uncharacterized protein (DUF924 family)